MLFRRIKGTVLDALKTALALKPRCWRRAGVLDEVDSSELVPGDIVAVCLGDYILAD